MIVTLTRETLVAALSLTVRVAEARNTIPILGNIMLRASGQALSLTATDLDIVATLATGDVTVETEGAVTVPAHMLADIAKKLPAGALIRLAHDGAIMALSAGRSRFRLPTLPVGDWPDFTADGFTHRLMMRGDDLVTLIEATDWAVSTEETRYYLNGIFLHAAADAGGQPVLRAVSTDGHRLALRDMAAPAGAEGMPGIIVPRKALAEIVRLAAGQAEISVEVSETRIRVSRPDASLLSKLIDGTFPDYARVISQGGAIEVTVERDAFAAALDRVQTVLTERSRAVKIEMARDTCTASAAGEGEASETLEAALVGEPITIGVNGRYALDICGHVPAGPLLMTMDTPGSPILITSPQEQRLRIVLMPLRV